MALDQIGNAGGGQQHDREAEQHGEQGLLRLPDDPAEARQPRRVADVFEGPDETEQAGRGDPGQRGKRRQGAQQIENPAERHRPEKPRPQRAVVLVARQVGRGNQAQHVFGDEKGADEVIGAAQHRIVVGRNDRHRVGQHRGNPDRDQDMVHQAKQPRRPGGAVGIEQHVQPPAVHRGILGCCGFPGFGIFGIG